MFRALITPIFRSIRLCVTACGIMHPRCCRPATRSTTSCLHYTTSCNTQSSAPEYGQYQSLKHVQLIGIINKPLLLHLVGVYIIYVGLHLVNLWVKFIFGIKLEEPLTIFALRVGSFQLFLKRGCFIFLLF